MMQNGQVRSFTSVCVEAAGTRCRKVPGHKLANRQQPLQGCSANGPWNAQRQLRLIAPRAEIGLRIQGLLTRRTPA